MEDRDTSYTQRMVEAAERDGFTGVPAKNYLFQLFYLFVLPVVCAGAWSAIPMVRDGRIMPVVFSLGWHPVYIVTSSLLQTHFISKSTFIPASAFLGVSFFALVWVSDACVQLLMGHLCRWGGLMRILDCVSLLIVAGGIALPVVMLYIFVIFKLDSVPALLLPASDGKSRPMVLTSRFGGKAWSSVDLAELKRDRESRVRVVKLCFGTAVVASSGLALYSFCMGFSIFAEREAQRSSSSRVGLLRSVLGVTLSVGVRIIGVVMKRLAEVLDRTSNTGKPSFLGVAFSVEMFNELFGKFLFISVSTWSSFAIWQGFSFAAELVSWPLKMTKTYFDVKRRVLGGGSKVQPFADAFGSPAEDDGVEAHRRLHAVEFFLHFGAQRLGSLAILVLTATWRSSSNSSQFEISSLSSQRYTDVVVFLLAQAGAELVQSALILVLFKRFWSSEPMKQGPRWIEITGSSFYLFLWATHIITDIVIFKCLHKFEGGEV